MRYLMFFIIGILLFSCQKKESKKYFFFFDGMLIYSSITIARSVNTIVEKYQDEISKKYAYFHFDLEDRSYENSNPKIDIVIKDFLIRSNQDTVGLIGNQLYNSLLINLIDRKNIPSFVICDSNFQIIKYKVGSVTDKEFQEFIK